MATTALAPRLRRDCTLKCLDKIARPVQTLNKAEHQICPTISLIAGSYLPRFPELSTPSLNSKAAQGSVRALELPSSTCDMLKRKRTFDRRIGGLKIKTVLEQEDDAGSATFRYERNKKQVIALTAKRKKDEAAASYKLELFPKWGDISLTLGKRVEFNCAMNLKLFDKSGVTLSTNSSAKLGRKPECSMRGIASYSRKRPKATVRLETDGRWNVKLGQLNVHAKKASPPTIAAHGHELSWCKGWPSMRVKAMNGKFRFSRKELAYNTSGWRAGLKPKAIFGEISYDGGSVEAEIARDGMLVKASKEEKVKGEIKRRVLASADTRTGIALRLGWFF